MQFRKSCSRRVNRALLVTAVALAPWCAAVADELAVGAAAPDFKLIGSDGKTYTSAQFKGRQAVVIAWFPKAFTGGCTKECVSFREGRKALSHFDVAYFTASCDPAERNKEFAESLRLDYPILSDSDKSVATAFGCLNSRGVANRWTYYIGKDGTILHIDKSVQPTRHAEAVAAKLKELGVAEK